MAMENSNNTQLDLLLTELDQLKAAYARNITEKRNFDELKKIYVQIKETDTHIKKLKAATQTTTM
jgi:hypothetical protein